LCYVGMTRAMDQLVVTRAVYRRRYGTDMPEASVPSRFLDEIPAELMEELGKSRVSTARVGRTFLSDQGARSGSGGFAGTDTQSGVYSNNKSSGTGISEPHGSDPHYAYEDEDQSAGWNEKAEAA